MASSDAPNDARTPGWRAALGQGVMTFLGAAAFPRLAHRLRWPTRLGPRGLVAYIAANTMLLFLLRQFVLPHAKRVLEEAERATDELRLRLGREPTDAELNEYLGRPLDGR